MIFWALTLILAVSCLLAATLKNFRHVVLSAWCAQLAFGGLAMQMGASYLGLLAWIFGSLGTVVLIAYGSVFGELFHSELAAQPPAEDVEGAATRAWKRILYPLGGVVSGAFLSGLVLFAVSQGVAVVAPEVQTGGDGGKYDLYQIGTYLSADPIISVFSIGMLFVIALFGLGVVTRPRRLKSSSGMSQAQETP